MARFSVSLLFFALSIIPAINALSTAPPFWLRIVGQSQDPNGTPLYLTSTGSTTRDKNAAAVCWNSPYGELFCGDFSHAIGVPSNTDATVLKGCVAERCLTKQINIDSNTLALDWSQANFWYSASTGSAWATLRGAKAPTEDAVPATMLATFG
ncbi:uncharacterized protein BP5553_06252 [Venustampulla echinocandica]|uniref:Uncharacterized protein n=1 Tax=Venustampulla echinocandica TaxID=2656787 RepID=A0A370TMZ0_9HELO|nr:uncharacterized protein BP5553_06252 [Venustampulla echinocandica]RDL36900.1 hypothetical protein BP5553_06252 [Venustampulla echinocandica]